MRLLKNISTKIFKTIIKLYFNVYLKLDGFPYHLSRKFPKDKGVFVSLTIHSFIILNICSIFIQIIPKILKKENRLRKTSTNIK
jgi:hypothetical protein